MTKEVDLISRRDNFKNGCVELVVMSLLNELDMYGYEMWQEITRRGDEHMSITETTLYLTLHRLEDKNFVSSKKVQSGKRRQKIYYHLEDNGINHFMRMKEEFYAINKSVRNILEFNKDKED
jgi:PadR family transcriptional regulator PadR